MSRLAGKRAPAERRLVLGFDGGCRSCGELARRIEERSAGKLEVLELRDPLVEEWLAKALGEGAPLVPTLFEVRGPEIRAWTGWRLGANLSRFLGPVDTWQVMQALGEAGEDEGTALGGGAGFTRGQFLKGLGGAAVAVSVLSATGGLASPASAAQAGGAASGSLARTDGEVIGASVAHPSEWRVERERYTLNETYGFALWRPEPSRSLDSHDHGGEPALRVALAYGLSPRQIEPTVRARLAEYPHLPMRREVVSVGGKGFKAVAVGPIPGSTPSTEVYVAVDGRVYQINVYGEELDAEGRRLLSGLRFGPPARSVESLGLPDARSPEALEGGSGGQRLVEAERSAKAAESTERSATAERSVQAAEYKLPGGCWVASSGHFFQTQHGKYANKRWGAYYTGWTLIGRPNYWGQYTHGNLGYGRCDAKIYTNDKYAIDYPLGRGDVVFSPFKRGTVTFAGRNYTHRDYGIFVSIKAENGKYVNLSAHLNGLAPGIKKGAKVTDETIIGYAGNTGGPDIPVGEPHLHQAYYRYPRYNPDGSPYGGAALKVVYHRYVGTAAGTGPGVYKFDEKSKGKWISN